MKMNYVEPKIHTGGVDVSKWSSLTKNEREAALKKPWFVYFSFRDPKTGKLKRQPFIKGGANRHKTKTDRLRFLRVLQRNLLVLLEAGFNPYEDNSELIAKFRGEYRNQETLKTVTSIEQKQSKKIPVVEKEQVAPPPIINSPSREESTASTTKPQGEENLTSVAEAFEMALKIKKSILNQNSYPKYRSRVNRFQKWLDKNVYDVSDIRKINRKTVISYLNDVLQQTSPRNRNNTRAALSSLFSTLEENELIAENFILKINVLRSVPERNKTYTPHQLKEIDSYLKTNDPLLRLFVQFVSYNFLRPIEICRLKIGDVDVQDKKLYVRAKNKAVKIKIIPDIMINNLPDISDMDKDHYLFTPERFGGKWETDESNKRDYFSKRFKKVKDHFKLGKDYGLYSYRHTFITKLYRELEKNATPEEVKSKLMLITGHTSPLALEKYLRDIDASLPEDYSKLFKPSENNITK
ncbi:site-specific integrase [Zobellia roscoffensis]|uniref:tyrosine-type recombinase/integrase n=1 Tax=Zobellia roscoffensis TaxID=2779508 RepID=UPI001D04CFD3|nr:site-specific integrase [Zobellia roscoffensis]